MIKIICKIREEDLLIITGFIILCKQDMKIF